MNKRHILKTLFFLLLIVVIIFIVKIFNKNNNKHNNGFPESPATSALINEKITLALKGDENTVIAIGGKYEDLGCVATGESGTDFSSKVTVSGEVDTSKIGTYTVTYSLNNSTITRNVEVRNSLSQAGLPVLMYHFFYDKKVSSQTNGNYMEVSNFEEQMKYLSDNNYYFPSWEEVEKYVAGDIDLPERSVLITVDDGDVSFFELAIPIINKYNVKATSFVITSWWAGMEQHLTSYKSNKIDLQSHSETFHSAGSDGKGKIMTASSAETIKDLQTSQERLGGATVFCYPFGHYNSTVEQTVKKAGFNLAFTVNGGRVTKHADPLALPRVRMSIGTTISQFKNLVK